MTLAVDAEPKPSADPPEPPGVPRWTLAAFAFGGLVLLAIAALAIAWKDDGSPSRTPRFGGQVLEPAPAATDDRSHRHLRRPVRPSHGHRRPADARVLRLYELPRHLLDPDGHAQTISRPRGSTGQGRVHHDRSRPRYARTAAILARQLRPRLHRPDRFARRHRSGPARNGRDRCRRRAVPANGNYTVGHSSAVYVFTGDDAAHLAYPAGTRQEDWADDLPGIASEPAWQAP